MLRKRSLTVLLEDNQYQRKSLKGFINDFPQIFAGYREICEQHEAYEMLNAMIHDSESIDQEYMIWVKYQERAQILELKEVYSTVECHILSQKTGIPFSDFELMTAGY